MRDLATVFGRRELDVLDRVVPVARELTGSYFALTDEWFDEASHEVCTLSNLRRTEILGEGYLAQIRRLYRVLDEEPGRFLRSDRVCPHYRICLQDHNLFRRLRWDPAVSLPELLTCVLTHEYVHLIRFCRLEHPYEARGDLRLAEEAHVERVTRRILSRCGDRKLRQAAERVPVV